MNGRYRFQVFLFVLSIMPHALFSGNLLYFWSGGITHQSGIVNAILKLPSEKVRLVVADNKNMNNAGYSNYESAKADKGNAVSIQINNLQPLTTYYYQFEIDGILDNDIHHTGSFTTFSEDGFSYSFVAGSCNFFPNNRVYDKMKSFNPLFLIMPGDLHYANVSSKMVVPHQDAYEQKVLQHKREANFYKDVPIAYVWDDHDYCGDNNDGTDGCGKAAYQAYMNYVPHYPLGNSNGQSIYQAFTAGRIRFVLTDLRSDRREGNIMSSTQINWFKNELLMAKQSHQLICWVSSVSYTGTGNDNWGGYASTRTEIANFLKENEIENMFIISGDAHMLAVDNGSNGDYSSQKDNPFLYPILQSAALNNVGSYKGGVFSEGGPYPNNPPFNSQWSKIDVIDNNGADIGIRFTCYRLNPGQKNPRIMIDYFFCRTIDENKTSEFEDLFSIHHKQSERIIEVNSKLHNITNIYMYDYRGKQVHRYINIPFNFSGWIFNDSLLGNPGKYFILAETPDKKYVGHFSF